MWEQNHGFPRFKKVGRMRSFSFPQLGKNPLQNGCVKLPVIGFVKYRQSRSIPDGGVLKQARVVKRVSGWYVMLTAQWLVNPPQRHLLQVGEPAQRSGLPMPHGEGIGIDVGLTSMVATSSGLMVKRPLAERGVSLNFLLIVNAS
ncbi:MAG: hypothetical protein WBA39_29405 [Rivularia sp. (in: cyanobacteria)]